MLSPPQWHNSGRVPSLSRPSFGCHVQRDRASRVHRVSNGVETVGEQTTYTALAAARLTGMIESLPHGADTMLSTQRRDASGDAGITLSGGQWDRVAVARARYAQLLGDPIDLVVLDEPNAGLDPISEAQLMGDILAFGEGATRLIISHRLGLVAESNHVVVMRDGEICERGSRSELLARGGSFQRMFSAQAAAYVMRDSGDVVG